MCFNFSLWILINSLTLSLASQNHRSTEKLLIKEILDRYAKLGQIGRPVEKSTDVINVNFGLALIQLLDLEENKQILRTSCWIRLTWHDKLLNWMSFNNSEFNSIEQIRIFPEEIWTPDIKLYNFADERLLERRTARVVVFKNGDVLWIPQALFKSTCPVHITYFPYDSQICEMDFGSWSYDVTQLNLTWWLDDSVERKEVPYIDFHDYVPSNEWFIDGQGSRMPHLIHTEDKQIKSIKFFRHETNLLPDKSIETRRYVVLRYRLRMSRNSAFYESILVIPCILLSCLTLVVFWLPPESSAKMMLGMNIFVAFFVLLLLLAESTPSAVKDFPLIGSYYCFNMVMITCSTFLAVVVVNLYLCGDRKERVPYLVRKIFIGGMSRLFYIQPNIPKSNESELMRGLIEKEISKSAKESSNSPVVTSFGSNKPFPYIDRSSESLEDIQNQSSNRSNNAISTIDCDKLYLTESNFFEKSSGNQEEDWLQEEKTQAFTEMETDVREIKRYIEMYVSIQKDRENRNLTAIEWRTVAIILDRLFFVLYVIALFVALLTLLPTKRYLKQLDD